MGISILATTTAGDVVAWELSPEGVGMESYAIGLTFQQAMDLATTEADVFGIARGYLDARGAHCNQLAMLPVLDEELGDY